MLRKLLAVAVLLLVLLAVYLLLWPVPVEPVAWQAPVNEGYTGVHATNTRLAGMETFPLGGLHGPEDIALDRNGVVYTVSHEGWIVRLNPNAGTSSPERWVDTQGAPLGLDFDKAGNLIVADAYRGLLSVSPGGKVTELATEADGVPILYADGVAIAVDGKIYFSDASTKFSAKKWGGTYPASLLDIMEHGGHGRLLVYDPATAKATTVLKGLNFANGVAVAADQSYVAINETGSYRVMRYWLSGAKKGTAEPLIENLPGFPDNLKRGLDGRFWVGLVSPRNPLLDRVSGAPFLRKMIQRLPALLRPAAVPFSHVVAIDGSGKVVADLQDPRGAYPAITGAIETKDYLYVSSLVTPVLARLPKSKAGL
ncbi:MAG: SMP-30/gluconolactonase/LRE family protein [SAR324 cluster bacterium]